MQSKRAVVWRVMLGLAMLVAGCKQSSGAVTSVGDATRGEALFQETTLGAAVAPGCVTCHAIEGQVVLVGPSLAGVAKRAANVQPGKTAEMYLSEAIVDPNAYVTQGFSASVMYPSYGKDLNEQEIKDLVAYLLTLK